MEALPITGGCLCGAVRFSISARPMAIRQCWCRLCQYLGSGSATVNVCFPADAVTISGPIKDYCSVADSGNVMHRGFCPECGTQISSAAEARPHLLFIRAGALDDVEIARPEVVIWASRKPSWAVLDPALPHHEQQIPPVTPAS